MKKFMTVLAVAVTMLTCILGTNQARAASLDANRVTLKGEIFVRQEVKRTSEAGAQVRLVIDIPDIVLNCSKESCEKNADVALATCMLGVIACDGVWGSETPTCKALRAGCGIIKDGKALCALCNRA